MASDSAFTGDSWDEGELTLKLRRALKRSWQPFFGRFGRLTSIQLAAMPVLLKGRSALVCAPTATGKTEAAVAPLVERAAARPCPDETGMVRILYITPTRALANDLETRLAGPLADMGLRFAVRTGERKESDDGRPTELLVTTPESLDSIMARHRRNFSHLNAVVLDEIHLLDCTSRGDQLRVLLHRLRQHERHAQEPLQTVALSATVGAPEAVASRYLCEGEVVQQTGQRPFVFTVHESLEEIVNQLRGESLHKALVFCNSRRDVESTVEALRELWPRDRVIAHHGSLSKRERLESESALRQWTWGIAVATTTLEIGVDIGNIDAVVLNGPPPSLEALLQRMGRACRRGGPIRLLGWSAVESERVSLEHLAAQAEDGELSERHYAPDLAVVVQQILSSLYGARGGLEFNSLTESCSPLAPPEVVREIVSHLVENGHLKRSRNHHQLSQFWMDQAEKGKIHSHIADEKDMLVIDAASGKELGRTAVREDAEFVRIAGRLWQVVARDHALVRVRPVAAKGIQAAFTTRESNSPFTVYLPDSLKGTV